MASSVGRDGQSTPARTLTVEHALYGVLLLAALGLRFYALGSLHLLSPLEAAQAWPAWMRVSAVDFPQAGPPLSPLLFTLQRLLFALTGGGSDAWARAVPALAGSALVLVAWTLRPRLGRGGALAAALLLAVDPWLLAFSRLSDSTVLSVALGLGLLGLLFSLPDPESPDAVDVVDRLAVVAGLYLISGPLAWLLLPVILPAALVRGAPLLSRLSHRRRARAILLFAGTGVVGATGLFAHLDGLATLGESLGAAIRSLTGGGESVYPGLWPFLRLFVDQPLILPLGVAGLVLSWIERSGREWSRRRLWGRLLLGWTAWGLALVLLPGRNPQSLVVLGLPLLLAASSAVARLLRYALTDVDWQEGALIAVTMGVLFVTAAFWTGNYSETMDVSAFDVRPLLFYLLLPGLGAFFVWWSGWRTSSQVFGLLLLATLFLAALSSSWAMNLRTGLARGEDLFAVTGHTGIRLLVDDVARLSSLRDRDPTATPVLVDVEPSLRPLLGWYLRRMQNLQLVNGVDANLLDRNAMVVAEPGAELRLPGDFIGSRYEVVQNWLPTDIRGLRPLLRWVLYRELQAMPAVQSVDLWVKQE